MFHATYFNKFTMLMRLHIYFLSGIKLAGSLEGAKVNGEFEVLCWPAILAGQNPGKLRR